MFLKTQIGERIEAGFAALGLDGPALVQISGRPEFGDYQANGVMAAAKKAQRDPREVAAALVDVLNMDDIASQIEVAGPGFLNITLRADFVAHSRAAEVDQTPSQQTIVVDYSAPNLAKEMHVGHLRSSIIGDCVARVLQAQGHRVIRQNHVGDWGTQFGMLLTYMQDSHASATALADLEDFYRAAKQQFDSDAAFRDRSRQAVVALQAGNPDALDAWQRFIDASMSHCQDIYDRLGVKLTTADIRGESSYNDDLSAVVSDLDAGGLLQASDGAQCVFLDEFKSKSGEILPVIVRKSDGGYLYATTDLAAVRYRVGALQADRVLYFTDARQALHFRQIFTVARRAGFIPEQVRFEHMPFGSMLGADGKPFKTRAGGVVKLADLLDEAERRATALALTKNPELDPDEAQRLGRVIGIGAIKYADLSKNRTSDYVFDWDLILSFDGNTSPYLQYAYTRIQSVFARGGVDPQSLEGPAVAEDEPERRLAVAIAGFNDTLQQVADDGMPHILCGYLYDLATRFSQFYEACPILSSEEPARRRRLTLAKDTALTLEKGLGLLGIGVVDRM